MEVPIINIGNSKGIIISKTILEQYGFMDKVELVMEEDHLELKPVTPPRQSWLNLTEASGLRQPEDTLSLNRS